MMTLRHLTKQDVVNATQARVEYPRRVEQRYIEPKALREALINAFAHNDYSSNEDTPICEIYEDRIVIVSYGNPLDAMTEDDFFTGLSKPRNPLIMRIFQDLEYVERSGRGLPMIVEEYGREAFSFSRIAMKATFVFDKSMEEGERAAIGSEEKSKEKSKERILELIREDSQITTADLAKSTGLSIAGIEKNLRQLKESGKIRRVGPDKGGHWEIIR